MCLICHTDISSNNPPLKNFPASFNEPFNVKFDHAQHKTGAARPQQVAPVVTIRRSIAARDFRSPRISPRITTVTPVTHPQVNPTLAARSHRAEFATIRKRIGRQARMRAAFRYAFSHADHDARERLACADCHKLTAGAPQTRQVSSPAPAQHFVTTRGKTCLTCHTGKTNVRRRSGVQGLQAMSLWSHLPHADVSPIKKLTGLVMAN